MFSVKRKKIACSFLLPLLLLAMHVTVNIATKSTIHVAMQLFPLLFAVAMQLESGSRLPTGTRWVLPHCGSTPNPVRAYRHPVGATPLW
jgi:hypothetical protein